MDGETGWLVPIEQLEDGSGTPVDENKFVNDWGNALKAALESGKLKSFGDAGRIRAVEEFSWESIATRTLDVYSRAVQS